MIQISIICKGKLSLICVMQGRGGTQNDLKIIAYLGSIKRGLSYIGMIIIMEGNEII